MGDAQVFNGDWVEPTLAWEMAYAWTEKCLGLHGDFKSVKFGVADSLVVRGQNAAGMWLKGDDGTRAIVYVRSWLALDEDLLVHEMIHDVTAGTGGEWPTPRGQRESRAFRKCLPSLRAHG